MFGQHLVDRHRQVEPDQCTLTMEKSSKHLSRNVQPVAKVTGSECGAELGPFFAKARKQTDLCWRYMDPISRVHVNVTVGTGG